MSDPVKISDLKDRLSHYLRRVRAGETVLVADRDRVIARIEPVREGAGSTAGEPWIDELERRGAIRRPRRPLPRGWLKARPPAKADVVRALLAEREEGR